MKNKIFFNLFSHYLIYIIAALSFAYFLDISMPDDGLRHISFANNTDLMKSWGEIFPYSLFTSYDPWFLWHSLLSSLMIVIDFEYIHIVVNFFVILALLIIVDIYIRCEIKYDFASFIYIIVFSVVFLSANRYIMVRPDLLSGLFILISLLLKNKFIPIFLLTIFYSPFYYLFFIYTGSIGLVVLIQKKWKIFFGVFIGSIFSLGIHLLYDTSGYILTVKNILMDQNLRMGLEVSEGKPLFNIFGHLNYFILLPVFLLIGFFLISKNYNYFQKNSLALFLLITSILWINQIRYFVLFLPIIIIYVISIVSNTNKKIFFNILRKYFVLLKRNVAYSKKAVLFYVIAIPYCIFAFTYAFNTKSLNKDTFEAKFFANKIFNEKTILLNNLHADLYRALYYNPTIKFIPSCSVGWFDDKKKEIKDIYIRMQKEKGINEKELLSLVQYVNADYYIHYLRNKKQILDFDKLKKFGIIPEMIYHNRIIFRIKKEK